MLEFTDLICLSTVEQPFIFRFCISTHAAFNELVQQLTVLLYAVVMVFGRYMKCFWQVYS